MTADQAFKPIAEQMLTKREQFALTIYASMPAHCKRNEDAIHDTDALLYALASAPGDFNSTRERVKELEARVLELEATISSMKLASDKRILGMEKANESQGNRIVELEATIGEKNAQIYGLTKRIAKAKEAL